MASLKLKQEDRNKLYFNKYKYRASFELIGARFTYYCETYDECLRRIYRFKESPWNSYDKDFTIDYEKLRNYIGWRLIHKDSLIIRTEYEKVSIFSNDIELLKSIKKIDKDTVYTEAIVIAPEVLFFENKPEHNYRIYLKGVKLDNNSSDSICSFVKTYQNSPNIRISPALVNAVENNRIHVKRWIHNSYFIDYSNESSLSLIKLLLDDLVSPKVYKLDSKANKDKYSNNMECLHGQNS